MSIRELEILRAALEGDIIRQKESNKLDHPAFKEWLIESEKLFKKVTLRLITENGKKEYLEESKFYKGYDPGSAFFNL